MVLLTLSNNNLMKIVFTLLLIYVSLTSTALDGNHFTIVRETAPYFVVDGNSPASGPTSAYVGLKVTNTSSITYSRLKFTVLNITSSVAGQNYAMLSPSSGLTVVGTLAPGESKVCFYFISYPANNINADIIVRIIKI